MQGKEKNRKSRKKENDEEQANKQIENCEKNKAKTRIDSKFHFLMFLSCFCFLFSVTDGE